MKEYFSLLTGVGSALIALLSVIIAAKTYRRSRAATAHGRRLAISQLLNSIVAADNAALDAGRTLSARAFVLQIDLANTRSMIPEAKSDASWDDVESKLAGIISACEGFEVAHNHVQLTIESATGDGDLHAEELALTRLLGVINDAAAMATGTLNVELELAQTFLDKAHEWIEKERKGNPSRR